MASKKAQNSSSDDRPGVIPYDLGFIQRIIVDNFKKMPLWVRVVTYLTLLIFTLYTALVPRFIYGTCMMRGSGGGEDPYRDGAVGVYVESQLILAKINEDGAWAVPLVSKLPKNAEIYFVTFKDGKKTLYPVRLNFLSIMLTDHHKVYLTTDPQPRFSLASSSSSSSGWSIFSRAAYAQSPTGVRNETPASSGSTSNRVAAIVAKTFRVDASTLAPTLDLRKDLGADSIKLSQLVSDLQRQFRLTIDSAAWNQISTIGDINRYIERRQRFLSGIESLVAGSLQSFRSHEGLYLAPTIPKNKLNNARTAADVPKDESTIGLIDATLFGSADLAILFGRQGLYFRTSWTRKEGPKKAFIDYEEFARRTIAEEGSHQVSLGNGQYFVVAGSDFEPEELVRILTGVQGAIRDRLRAI